MKTIMNMLPVTKLIVYAFSLHFYDKFQRKASIFSCFMNFETCATHRFTKLCVFVYEMSLFVQTA
jgi:hypothetical protein